MDDLDAADSRFVRLHNALWSAIAARRDISGTYEITEPALVPAEPGYSDAKLGDHFPALKHLDHAVKIARDHEFREIAEAFSDVAELLPWSQNPRYTEGYGGLSLLNGYAYASLSGPEGPIKCMAPRGGFYLMGPDVLYPSHNHAPREIYLVMTPGVDWRLDEGNWFEAEAGDLIYHAPWQMHAMRSGATPVLAYAAWLEPGNRNEIGFSETAEEP